MAYETGSEVTSLTEEQHEVLENLHNLINEVNSEELYEDENAEYYDRCVYIQHELNRCGLSKLGDHLYDLGGEEIIAAYEWYYMEEEEQAEWEVRAKALGKEDGHALFDEENQEYVDKYLGKWDNRISEALTHFDAYYGTHYHASFYRDAKDPIIKENPFGEPLKDRLEKVKDINASKETLQEYSKDVHANIRYNIAKHKNTPTEVLIPLLKDKDFDVVYETLLNENLSSEVLEKQATLLIMDRINGRNHKFIKYAGTNEEVTFDEDLLVAIAENPNTSPKVLKSLENFDNEYVQDRVKDAIKSRNNKLIDLTKVTKEKEKNKEQSPGMEL